MEKAELEHTAALGPWLPGPRGGFLSPPSAPPVLCSLSGAWGLTLHRASGDKGQKQTQGWG